jgi:Fe-S-cluster-containing dehydrogenase component
MNLDRRDFIKVLSAGAVTASTFNTLRAENRYKLPSNAPGILYDATVCIGCKACEMGCKTYNNKPAEFGKVEQEFGVGRVWDSASDLSGKTMNVIKLYKNGTGEVKNREIDGHGFVKRACMHCIDPDCVSACPVSALTKNDQSGIVQYDKDACIGCRYCQVACPFNIPKFEFDETFPEIVKCEFCSHKLAEGGIPGCCEYCPTGASLYGSHAAILKEANHRLTLAPGSTYDFPISDISRGETSPKKVAKYVNYIYGERDGGGTQYLLLSAIPFAKLGLPTLPTYSDASQSEGLQHTIYKGLIAPVTLLLGLIFAAHRSMSKEQAEVAGGEHGKS